MHLAKLCYLSYRDKQPIDPLKHIIILILLLCGLQAAAQKGLSTSPTQAPYTYVYQIPDKAFPAIYRSQNDESFIKGLFTTPVDSFLTNIPQRRPLPPGNYLLVTAVGNQLRYSVDVVHNAAITVLNNNRDLIMVFNNEAGEPISDAEVHLDEKTVPYDPALHAYRLKKYKGNAALIQAKYKGVLNLYRLGANKYENRQERSASRYRAGYGYKGYLSFSQPKYKPNDTVRLKAFLVNKKGIPVNEDLRVRLQNRHAGLDTVLKVLHPYRAGGFEYQFIMKDSLQLDQQYTVFLEKGMRTLFSNSFYFEQYELQKINLHAKVNKTSTQRNEPVILTMRATDDNNLPLLDARVRIVLTSNEPQNYYAAKVFVRDTLYDQTMPVEAIGETVVQFADSIFPAANFSYSINCQLLNAENESKMTTLYQRFTNAVKKLDLTAIDDSLHINMLVGGKPVQDTATLSLLGKNDIVIGTQHIRLPAVVKLAPFVLSYQVTSDSMKMTYMDESSLLGESSKREHDSVYFSVDNPSGLPFWYTIYTNKRITARGYGGTLNWKAKAAAKNDYYLQLQYIRGSEVITRVFPERYFNKKLTVAIHAPATIAPGQESNIQISVTDPAGKPVPDADVTAYSYTSKLNQSYIQVPYLGKSHSALNARGQYYTSEGGKESETVQLNFDYFRPLMHLDTIKWYQFTHPAPVFRYDEAADDNITQIAPFLISDGYFHSPVAVYIDRMPVYYYGTTQEHIFSFRTPPGAHTLQIRTADLLITYDTIEVHAGVKNFVSIDVLHPGKGVTIEKRPDRFSEEEAAVLNHYLITVNHRFREKMSYIKQDSNMLLITPANRYRVTPAIVGPLTGAATTLTVHKQFVQTFTPEQGYHFDISAGLIKQTSIAPIVGISRFYNVPYIWNQLEDQVLTTSNLQTYLPYTEYRRTLKTDQNYYANDGSGKLIVALPPDSINTLFYTLLFRYNDTSFIRVYDGKTKVIRNLDSGMYKLMFLYNKDRFAVQENIYIKANGLNYYQLTSPLLQSATAISKQDSLLINRRIGEGTGGDFVIRTSRSVTGIVRDSRGNPIPGATVMVKGTNLGTSTDMTGHFTLAIPSRGIIYVTSIGYVAAETQISGSFLNITLAENVSRLEEVVVAAYSTAKRKAPADGVSTIQSDVIDDKPTNVLLALQGEVAGLTITTGRAPEQFRALKIKVNPAELVNGIPEAMPQGAYSLRTHFSDAAFWQPKLRTDSKGIAAFTTTFPDDITNWRVYALVMNDHKQSGQDETSIKAFKGVSANLAVPNFAVAGDSMNVIGKALNYTSDTLQINRTFSVNDTTRMQHTGQLIHSLIDTLLVTIPARDSMRFKYVIDKLDGEQRSIPVFPAGTRADTGVFAALYSDTTLTFSPGLTGPVRVYAEAAILPVLMKEIKYVQHYKYLCNEQLASKLKAYLLEKRVKAYLNQKFEHNKDINTIISKLNKTQQDGMWGWWEKTEPSLWITQHVIEALYMAQEDGYDTQLNTSVLADDLLSRYHSGKEKDSLGCVMLLAKLKAKVDFSTMTGEIRVYNGDDSLRLLTIKQLAGLPVNLQPILAGKQTTTFGNAYWGQYTYSLFYSSIQQTLMVYKLLRKEGGHEDLLQKIRGYFLEERRSGQWRNTYESSEILATILPDLLKAEGMGKATLAVNGSTVSNFPFDTTITQSGGITFIKKGGMPVYLTATQEYWDASPASLFKTFEVKSRLNEAVLTTGKPVTLTVEVYAKSDADYVMVEVPIPAGCSYASKPQSSWLGNEVHREYEKEMVSIFCNKLTRGTHIFTVELMPRYTGKYTLNPAKATMQYFPLFMGRTGMKKITIQ